MAKKKVRVAVLYGGRSGEHEVSLQSAASVIRNLDRERFEVIPVAIDKEGRWLLNDVSLINEALAGGSKSLPVFAGKTSPTPVVLPPSSSGRAGETALIKLGPASGAGANPGIDVVFPVMHGPLCEDGTIQGLLELADVAYVGCGVLSSAVSMDKDVAKRLAKAAGLPVVPSLTLKKEIWALDPVKAASDARGAVDRSFGFPCFVKPANLGSSVGVSKVKNPADFAEALKLAFQYDRKILVEQAIAAREIEVSVLENPEAGKAPLVSIAGEIVPHHEFYSYEAKYLDENGAALLIPAKLDAGQLARVQALAREAFVALECEGMARADFFMDKATGELYLNELNTIPGFTSISMYPKMWEASGIPYAELLSKLIDLALSRQERKRALVRDFHAGTES